MRKGRKKAAVLAGPSRARPFAFRVSHLRSVMKDRTRFLGASVTNGPAGFSVLDYINPPQQSTMRASRYPRW